MKKITALLATIIISITAMAQTKGSIQVYGFQQPVLRGTIPTRVITEEGAEVPQEAKPTFTYYIYTASTAAVAPVEVWIYGKAYGASLQTVKSPVMDENPTSIKKNVLVPKTSKKVQQWNLKGGVKGGTKGSSLAKANELVVVYKVAGKSYYQVLKKLKNIDPVVMQ